MDKGNEPYGEISSDDEKSLNKEKNKKFEEDSTEITYLPIFQNPTNVEIKKPVEKKEKKFNDELDYKPIFIKTNQDQSNHINQDFNQSFCKNIINQPPKINYFKIPKREFPDYPNEVVELPIFTNIEEYEKYIQQQKIQLGSSLGTTALMGFFSVPLSFISGLSSIPHIYNLRKYKKEFDIDTQKNLKLLEDRASYLSILRDKYKNEICKTYPDLISCLKLANYPENGLWTFNLRHKDFLNIRVGIFDGKPSYSIKIISNLRELDDKDDVFKLAEKISSEFSLVKEIPLTINLNKYEVISVNSLNESLFDFINAFVVNLSSHHSPTEVKIGAITVNDNFESNLEWLRWLPHSWVNNKRILSSTENTIENILKNIDQIMEFRKNRNIQFPKIILLVSSDLIFNIRYSEFSIKIMNLLKIGRKYGIKILLLNENLNNSISESEIEINLGKNESEFKILENSESIIFHHDNLTTTEAETFSRKISAVNINHEKFLANYPRKISFTDLYSSQDFTKKKIQDNWCTSKPHESLRFPIGVTNADEKVFLDLHEDTHGPHGLIGGTTGYGKGELIKTIILSASINYHPHELNFIFIDFAAAETARPLEKLPHVTGIISNSNRKLFRDRALESLSFELDKREKELQNFDMNINVYQRAWKNKKVKKPIPHLVIVIDEFSTFLKKENDDGFIKKIAEIAEKGRKLGIHLILSTQTPSYLKIGKEVFSNTTFRIGLKFEEKDDSRSFLNSSTAFEFPHKDNGGVGLAVLKTGQREKIIRVGYSGEIFKTEDNIIKEVELDGSKFKVNKSNELYDSEISYLVKLVNETSKDLGIEKMQSPWLPPVPKFLSLNSLNNNHFQNEDELSIPLGKIDNPKKQKQTIYKYNFIKDKNILILGNADSGKTTMLRSICSSIIKTNSPNQANIYILDLVGAGSYNSFIDFPHIGEILNHNIHELKNIELLLNLLLKKINKRKSFFAQKKLRWNGDYDKYPPIFFLIDGLNQLDEGNNNYNNLLSMRYYSIIDKIKKISEEGASYGVFIVASSLDSESKRTYDPKNFNNIFKLYLNNYEENNVIYTERFAIINNESNSILRIAYPGENNTEEDFHSYIKILLNNYDKSSCNNIEKIPDLMDVKLSDLMKYNIDSAHFGLNINSLENISLNRETMPAGFLITGPLYSGKSTVLKSLLMSIDAFEEKQVEFYFINGDQNSRFDYSYLDKVNRKIMIINSMDKIKGVSKSISGKLKNNIPIYIFIDNFSDRKVNDGSYNAKIDEEIIKVYEKHHHKNLFIFISAKTSGNMMVLYSNILKEIQENNSGIILGNQKNYLELLNIPMSMFPELPSNKGSGVYVNHGDPKLVQIAKS